MISNLAFVITILIMSSRSAKCSIFVSFTLLTGCCYDMSGKRGWAALTHPNHHTGPDLCKYAEHAKHDLSLLFFDLKIRGLEFRPLSIDTPLNLGIHAKIAMMPDQTERSLTSSYLHTPFAARFSASDMI